MVMISLIVTSEGDIDGASFLFDHHVMILIIKSFQTLKKCLAKNNHCKPVNDTCLFYAVIGMLIYLSDTFCPTSSAVSQVIELINLSNESHIKI